MIKRRPLPVTRQYRKYKRFKKLVFIKKRLRIFKRPKWRFLKRQIRRKFKKRRFYRGYWRKRRFKLYRNNITAYKKLLLRIITWQHNFKIFRNYSNYYFLNSYIKQKLMQNYYKIQLIFYLKLCKKNVNFNNYRKKKFKKKFISIKKL